MEIKDFENLLTQHFAPRYVRLIDQSASHVGHAETMGKRQKLYDLILVSDVFEGRSPVERHRHIYRVLGIGTDEEIHGISVRAYTEKEWARYGQNSSCG